MKNITKEELIKKSITLELPLKRKWMTYMLTIPMTDNEYVNITDGKYVVNVGDEEYIVTDAQIDKPIINVGDKINVPKGLMTCLDKEITTTITNLLVNYIILEFGLDGKFSYINEEFDTTTIWDKYIRDTIGHDITIDDYIKYSNSCIYLEQFASMVVVSSTIKMVTPAPNIDKYKKDKYKEYKELYGEDVFDDRIKIAEFEDEIKKYDATYIQDDPAHGIMISSKIQNQSRKLKYVSIGKPDTLSPDTKSKFIIESLRDGIPNDPHTITSIFTGIRVGSYARGNETKDSGLAAKNLIRPTRGFRIVEEDCGTSKTYRLKVTKDNYRQLKHRYYVVNNVTKHIPYMADGKKLIGETINLRDPLHCKAVGDKFCRICSGEHLYKNEHSILLLGISAGGKGLSLSLSKFHFKGLELTTLTKDTLFK